MRNYIFISRIISALNKNMSHLPEAEDDFYSAAIYHHR